MFARLFDSPVHLLILVLIIVVVFGWKRLPDAARSLGRSARILKSEVDGMTKSDASGQTVPGEQAHPTPEQPTGTVPGEARPPAQQPAGTVPGEAAPPAGQPTYPQQGQPQQPPYQPPTYQPPQDGSGHGGQAS